MAYFDFENEEDMKLCWNFTNIRIEKLEDGTSNTQNRLDLLAARAYFEMLFEKTQYIPCQKMAEKLAELQQKQLEGHEKFEKFIQDRKFYLDTLTGASSYYFDKLNAGTHIGDIRKEIEFLQKFEKKA